MGEKVPSGSVSALNLPEDKSLDTSDKGNDKTDVKTTEEPFLADWKTKDDANKGVSELKKTLGRQGDELGALRKQTQDLMSALTEKTSPKESAPDKPDMGSELEKIFNEYSKLDFIEDDDAQAKGADLLKNAVLMTAKSAKEEALKEAGDQVGSLLQEKDQQEIMTKFLESNPDFADLQEQGAFQTIKSSNQMHDDFSAYYAIKAEQNAAKVAELETQLADAQNIARLASGDANTEKVLSQPGQSLRTKNKINPANVSELKNHAMDAVRSVMGG